ncbi:MULTISPECIES: monodechloroaminopyrrolnitrin synthase PrnB family protein [unclassified Shewanella]|uniref:PrnB family protein n=1 Tax=unclassified Shewanella TaxID=196818 RepID=UPI001BC8264F|nr:MULTISPECIES: monodechloroaminopyrrolnitrin synthase PrnB family protein [unclassified Shewanella]GIU11231.1 tryptophan 2,3-dioxygenase KynA [Shewanella sp. MBTL60-112-B1]GIU30922.1 tryptophan 2,3-dioxygenase KynA [Shewanella sp. MBTL60-112-B2]
MTGNTQAFDHWIRTRFVELNSKLESLYAQQVDRANVEGVGEQLKVQLESEGRDLIACLLAEGNTDEGFDHAFDLLGNVGLYMAACRRHEITEPSRERVSPLTEASALAMHIGASIGVTPRFSTAHLTTHNRAHQGLYKRFTDLDAEQLFVDYNTKGILAYKRAADALLKIQPLGIDHPIAYDLLLVAKQALSDVFESNRVLFQRLDADDFFYCVRPYYKPHRVGSQIYRGANAGDFAGINVIDMLLGLCAANEPGYSQMLVDKFLYMMPEDQAILRDCMRRTSFMDELLNLSHFSAEPWYQQNVKLFLEVCALHGETAIQHHNELVAKYIAQPAKAMEQQHMSKVTASGPPLDVLLNSLEKLRDRRSAANRSDIRTRYEDIQSLTASLEAQ